MSTMTQDRINTTADAVDEPVSTDAMPDRWTKIRHGFTPAALMAGPVLIAAGFALHDEGQNDNVAFLHGVNGHINRWVFTHVLITAGLLCMTAGAGAIARLARGRARTATAVSAVMIAVGGLAGAYDTIGHSTLAYALAGRPDVAPITSASVQVDLYSRPWTQLFVGVENIALLGIVVLGVAMLRNRAIPRWAAALLIVSPATLMLAGSGLPVLAGAVPMILGMVAVARAARALSD